MSPAQHTYLNLCKATDLISEALDLDLKLNADSLEFILETIDPIREEYRFFEED